METKINIKNLQFLHEKLLKNEFIAELDMHVFTDTIKPLGLKGCGSAGCLIGNMSYFFKRKPRESWFGYSRRIFGRVDGNIWRFLFGFRWSRVEEDQREGALKRIAYVLKNGVTPNNWVYKKEYSSLLSISGETFHFSNLLLMHDKLLNNEFKAELDMRSYYDTDDMNITEGCGSLGCLIGNMSYFIRRKKSETWTNYGSRITGINGLIEADLWQFLFSARWYWVDEDLREGSLQRLAYILTHGHTPKNWLFHTTFSSKLTIYENQKS